MLERIRISIARASEIRNLERLVAASPRAKACNIHQLGHDRAVWCIPVPGQADRYMSASAGHIGSEMFAVHVDADAFYLAWLRSDEQCVLRSQMPRDYKYAYAVDGFAQGSSNPVPLADVGAWNDERGRSHIGFTKRNHAELLAHLQRRSFVSGAGLRARVGRAAASHGRDEPRADLLRGSVCTRRAAKCAEPITQPRAAAMMSLSL
ncbi:hypothetical protein XACG117_3260006 [Xanthomonas citri pv. citri]|nr:hypothetical protein XACG117_3260006 [Xanthomonas citri pv. citri]